MKQGRQKLPSSAGKRFCAVVYYYGEQTIILVMRARGYFHLRYFAMGE